mmetsp:Transcript_26935/g.86581  ORF Transcript_26935/g.86581 Transcript_26935/m.86581 type:complete len:194 (-) Transcript_26935:537-1118(-)
MYQDHGAGATTWAAAGGKLVGRTTFPDGTEMVEEFDQRTDERISKRWRTKTPLGAWRPWEYEFGSAPETGSGGLLAASASNPVFVPQDSRTAWVWRVRNIPYPKDVYELSVDNEKQQIVLRTSNRKYFKRFDVPELKRRGLKLDVARLRHDHKSNTLIVEYAKPREVLAEEARQLDERKTKAKADGDVECKQQ